MGKDIEILPGQTIENSERRKYYGQLVELEEYDRERRGLPSRQIVRDVDVIAPITYKSESEPDLVESLTEDLRSTLSRVRFINIGDSQEPEFFTKLVQLRGNLKKIKAKAKRAA